MSAVNRNSQVRKSYGRSKKIAVCGEHFEHFVAVGGSTRLAAERHAISAQVLVPHGSDYKTLACTLEDALAWLAVTALQGSPR